MLQEFQSELHRDFFKNVKLEIIFMQFGSWFQNKEKPNMAKSYEIWQVFSLKILRYLSKRAVH